VRNSLEKNSVRGLPIPGIIQLETALRFYTAGKRSSKQVF